MPAKDELLKSLSEQKKSREESGPEILAEWQHSLNALFDRIRAWLADSVATHLLAVETVPITITEGRLGTYEAASLKIVTPRGEAVHVAPKARDVVGAYGRVDLECSPHRIRLIRRDRDAWQFAQLTPEQGGWSYKALTEESFWETLQFLLS